MILVSPYPNTHNVVRDAALKVAKECDHPFIKNLMLQVATKHDNKHEARRFLLFAQERNIKVQNIAFDTV